jgi:hypothetical protein
LERLFCAERGEGFYGSSHEFRFLWLNINIPLCVFHQIAQELPARK